MRYTILTLLALSGCAMSPSERAWQTLHAIDVAQTLNAAGSSDPCWTEAGVPTKYLIGEKPSDGAVLTWGVSYSVLHYYADRWLERSNLPDGAKTLLRGISIANEAGIVIANHREGARPFGENARSCL